MRNGSQSPISPDGTKLGSTNLLVRRCAEFQQVLVDNRLLTQPHDRNGVVANLLTTLINIERKPQDFSPSLQALLHDKDSISFQLQNAIDEFLLNLCNEINQDWLKNSFTTLISNLYNNRAALDGQGLFTSETLKAMYQDYVNEATKVLRVIYAKGAIAFDQLPNPASVETMNVKKCQAQLDAWKRKFNSPGLFSRAEDTFFTRLKQYIEAQGINDVAMNTLDAYNRLIVTMLPALQDLGLMPQDSLRSRASGVLMSGVVGIAEASGNFGSLIETCFTFFEIRSTEWITALEKRLAKNRQSVQGRDVAHDEEIDCAEQVKVQDLASLSGGSLPKDFQRTQTPSRASSVMSGYCSALSEQSEEYSDAVDDVTGMDRNVSDPLSVQASLNHAVEEHSRLESSLRVEGDGDRAQEPRDHASNTVTYAEDHIASENPTVSQHGNRLYIAQAVMVMGIVLGLSGELLQMYWGGAEPSINMMGLDVTSSSLMVGFGCLIALIGLTMTIVSAGSSNSSEPSKTVRFGDSDPTLDVGANPRPDLVERPAPQGPAHGRLNSLASSDTDKDHSAHEDGIGSEQEGVRPLSVG